MTEVIEKPTVHEAWSAVMDEVQSISKESRNEAQKFNFRGIDAVMNTVGPVLRKHGVIVVPVGAKHDSERYTTKSGGQMVNRTVEMGYQVFGPRGDSFTGIAFGEAADSGDKAMAKAESVALRTFLLQALMIPTDEPDPDASSHERANPATDKGTNPVVDAAVAASQARTRLKGLADKRNWSHDAVAAAFSKHSNKELGEATADEVVAFGNLLAGGAVTIE